MSSQVVPLDSSYLSSLKFDCQTFKKDVAITLLVASILCVLFGVSGVLNSFGILHISLISSLNCFTFYSIIMVSSVTAGLSIKFLITLVKNKDDSNIYNSSHSSKTLFPSLVQSNATSTEDLNHSSVLKKMGIKNLQPILNQSSIFTGKKVYTKDGITFVSDKSEIPKDTKHEYTTVTYQDNEIVLKHSIGSGLSKTASLRYHLFAKKIDVLAVESLDRRKNSNQSYELAVLKHFSHNPSPYILQLEKEFQSTKKQKYQLEYCNGQTLTTSSTEKTLSKKQKLQIFSDILRGLAELHKFGYLHFDLHLGNIFVNDNRGKLGDFGNSRPLDLINDPEFFLNHLLKNNKWVVNSHLFSPEVLMNIESTVFGKTKPVKITEKADVWSLAIAMMESTGRIEFKRRKEILHLNTLPNFIRFIKKSIYIYQPDKVKENKLNKVIKLRIEDYPAPTDKTSLDYLYWWMLHPDPDKRASAEQAADFIDTYLSNLA